MALEMGLAALKALYQLAKMIKEAKDNVVLVNQKLHTSFSIEEVIELQLSSIGVQLPEDILHGAKTRMVHLRRTARRMKLKYQPLISILDHLGGSAATIKAESSRLSKGVLSASMALSCLAVMMRRHNDRMEANATDLLQSHLTSAGVTSLTALDCAGLDKEDFVSRVDASPALAGKFQLFLNELELQGRVSSFLDSLEFLVAELKTQDELLKDELDEEESRSSDHKSGYSLIPSYSSSKKKNQGQRREREETPGIEIDSLRTKGAQLILSQLCDESGEVVDPSSLSKAMRDGASPERLKMLTRQLGKFRDQEQMKDRVITKARLERFIVEEGRKNAGLNIALICSAILSTLESGGAESLGNLMDQTKSITSTVIRPLIEHALAFGLMVQSEGLREQVQDDPEEIAALQAEQDEKSLASRMKLMHVFAQDYAESYSYNLAPDASLLLSIAIDAGESKYGLGPSTRRRLELLLAILAVCNIEADKIAIERVEKDLKAELSLITSLGSSSMHEKISQMHADVVESAFDARRVLTGESADWWVASFGKTTHEVLWSRFKSAWMTHHETTSERDMKRLQFLLLDPRGQVTIDHFKDFTSGHQGSIRATMRALSSLKKLPENIHQLTSGKGGGKSLPSPTRRPATAVDPSDMSPSRRRLLGIDKQASLTEV